MSINIHQWHVGFNWLINIRKYGNKICLFLAQCYWLWAYWRSSEGAYVVTAINHDWSAYHDGLNDLNRSNKPKFTSKFSLIGVLIFWFPSYHPSSLNELHSTVGFDSPFCWAQSYFWPWKSQYHQKVIDGIYIKTIWNSLMPALYRWLTLYTQ